jgi:DNA-binding NarL/FixJ family response regulator
MNQIRLFLVDDEQRVRQGLRMRLGMELDMSVVGEAADGRSALDGVRQIQPDVVLMDVHLPGMDGVAATALMREAAPGCAVVMLSMQDDADTRARARAAGAVAFVAKHELERALTAAIRSAARRTEAEGGAAS